MKIREKMLKGVQTQVRSKIDFFKHFKLKQIRNPLLYLGPKHVLFSDIRSENLR